MPLHSRSKSGLGRDPIGEVIDSLEAYRNLPQVASQISPGRQGRPVHISTLTRWVVKGVRASDGSRIRLRAVRFPSGWRTTLEWVHEFIQAITADRIGHPVTVRGRRAATRRDRELDRKDRELDEDGY
jgi:hypothetical protein